MIGTDPRLRRYADAARHAESETGQAGTASDSPFGAGQYDDLGGLPSAAVRASLGCGNPTSVVDLQAGDIVLDLGSGGGLDVMLSARRVAPTGFAYGVDATIEMVDLARRNAAAAAITNVEFRHGTIEHLPLGDEAVDVVVSNCVIVLSDDKDAVFGEIHRVLRSGGRIGISDIVRVTPDDGTHCALDCAAIAISVDVYDRTLRRAGLEGVSIRLTDPLGGGLSNAIIRAVKPAAD